MLLRITDVKIECARTDGRAGFALDPEAPGAALS